MNCKLGLQLYTFREQLALNFEKTLETVALMGYEGVEFAGLHQQKPEKVRQLLKSLNLKIVSMHCDVLSVDGLQRSLDEAEALNCSKIICPWYPPETFEEEKSIYQLAEKLNFANEEIRYREKKLLYHNHHFEFRKLKEQYAFDILAKYLDPTIHFELDAYLAVVGGANPIQLLNLYHNRIEMLHLKDGLIFPPNPNLTVGDGNMNYTAIFNALPPLVKWLFVELEDSDMDLFKAVGESAQYIKDFFN